MNRRGPKSSKDFENSLIFHKELASMSMKELKILSSHLKKSLQKLSIAGNACGIAATFMHFHGRPSRELNNCIKMMKRHERLALDFVEKMDPKDDETKAHR
jgi:hypothetical protein